MGTGKRVHARSLFTNENQSRLERAAAAKIGGPTRGSGLFI